MRYDRYDARWAGGGGRSALARGERPGAERPRGRVGLPDGIPREEAAAVLAWVARLKQSRFGRVEIEVAEGRVRGAELVEKVDRKLIEAVTTA